MVPENSTGWRVRPYGEKSGDYQRVSAWLTARGFAPLMETTLPPHGVIIELDGDPVAASWIYLTYGIGVAFWEGLITRPGLPLAVARQACAHCVAMIKAIARQNDTGLIKAYVKRALLPDALACGFTLDGPCDIEQAMQATGYIPILSRSE